MPGFTFVRQFLALMRKNALIKMRLWPSTLAEIVLPILIMGLLAGLRSAISRSEVPDTHYVGATPPSGADWVSRPQNATFNYSASIMDLYSRILVPLDTTLGFVPSPGAGKELGDAIIASYPFLASRVRFFPDQSSMISVIRDPMYRKDTAHPGLYCGVIVTKTPNPSNGDYEWAYTLRMNATDEDEQAVPDTFSVPVTDDITLNYNSGSWNLYLYQGFMAVQGAIDTHLLRQVGYNGTTLIHTQPFPTTKHIKDDFADIIKSFLGLLFTLTFMWPVTRVTKVIVEEKELRIKEAMKIMGLSDFVLWFSWFITYAIIFAITSIGIIIVTGTNVYEYSDKGIIFLYFWLYGLSTFAFCYLIQAFFTRATVASTVAALVFLFSFFPYFAVSDATSSLGQKTIGCLSAPLCFGLGASAAATLESANQGVTNDSISSNVENFTFGTAIGMLIFDIIWYLLLGLYLDQVVPSTYGVPQKWYFLCTPKYWKSWCKRSSQGNDVLPVELQDAGGDVKNPNIEPVGEDMEARARVIVSHIRREFQSERADQPIVAVNDVSLTMYDGQIFALLGHNGAGKTTLISMLTGMIPPSGGDALIDGKRITTDMQSIRDSVGICPQHNILFDMLTVSEHLHLFARIKGVPAETIDNEVATFIQEVGLTEKANVRSAVLSGGQKRKLSVAIALIGGSRIVFLDEPTSGMDPYSRRSTWEILRRSKQGRVIILTTHFMDEADQLGDRIAIMAKGDVKCCGSSLFLKSRYGVGYTLTVSKHGDASALKQLVFSAVRSAEVLTEVAGEIAFRLPFDSSPAFPALFAEMDARAQNYNVISYGVSVTTLEEVFLRVGRDEEADQKTRIDNKRNTPKLSVVKKPASGVSLHEDPFEGEKKSSQEAEGPTQHVTSFDFNSINLKQLQTDPIRHVRALLTKRFHVGRRDRRVLMWQIFYPFLIMIIGVGLLKLGLSFAWPSQPIDTSKYNSPNRIMYNPNADVAAYAPLGSSFSNGVGAGNSVMVPYSDLSTIPTDDSDYTQLALNFSKNLLAEWKTRKYKESRYIAFAWEKFVPASSSNGFAQFTQLRLFHNTTASQSLPAGLNLYHNMIYQAMTGRNPTARISVTLDPMPRTADQEALQTSTTALLITIGLVFIPASFIGIVVREREVKAKHQQFLSGVDVGAYWISNYIWDFTSYLITAFLALTVGAIYDIGPLIGENAGPTVVSLILFGFSAPSFTYAISFLFSNSTSAQNITLLSYIFSGPLLLIASVVLGIIESTKNVNNVLKFFYRLLPQFCVGEALAELIVRKAGIATGGVIRDKWAMGTVGWPCLYMAIESIVYFGVVLLIEKILRTPQWLAKVSPDPNLPTEPFQEDEDIIAEKNRVNEQPSLQVTIADSSSQATPASAHGSAASSSASSSSVERRSEADIIQIKGLRKVYRARFAAPPKVAVHDATFGIPAGECFGFLGINGAGKTTTMQMLTGDVIPTQGTATLDGLDILTQQKTIRRLIGYCPQFDALIDSMTAREHLVFYSRIKGIPEELIPSYVDAMIKQLDLVEYADQPSKGYSGGNKRKLSVGVALIGNPPIVFLDEPSTGMDPKSRRFMWDLISSTMAGRSVMLTTHSMEECEALCARIGIMVSGRLRCLGTAQHLKHRYGDGYQIDVSCGVASTDEAVRFITESLPGSFVIERHEHTAKLRVPRVLPDGRRSNLAELFSLMETHRKSIAVAEYSISETTLEQIFIHFAKQQLEETGEVAGLSNLPAQNKK